jgi:hypothetical protein
MLLEKLLLHIPRPNNRDHPCFYLNVARTNVQLFSPLHSTFGGQKKTGTKMTTVQIQICPV